MSANTLHIDLPDAHSLGVWPWLIALISGAAMLAMFAQTLYAIPQSLQHTAQQSINAAGFDTIEATADGRDITLTGSVTVQQSVVSLFAQIEQIDGVRTLRDKLSVVDPAADAEAVRRSFLAALSKVDTSNVAFQAGSVSFTAASDSALDQIAQLMNAHPDTRIRIEGHTDDTGPSAVNLRLSQERAQAVANYLVNRGVSDDRLIAKGYGSTQPLERDTTASARARNRRIEISYVD